MGTSLTKAVAEAVKESLNGGSFSQQFTADRRWKASFELEELEELKVVVSPGPLSIQVYDRGADDERRFVHVAVLKQVDVDKRGEPQDEDTDPLVELLEEFLPHFRGAKLTVSPTGGNRTAWCIERGLVTPSASIIDEKHLDDQNTFVAVLRLGFRMLD